VTVKRLTVAMPAEASREVTSARLSTTSDAFHEPTSPTPAPPTRAASSPSPRRNASPGSSAQILGTVAGASFAGVSWAAVDRAAGSGARVAFVRRGFAA
jgi:hypothetical protein